jgi:rare lipoprotein A (peptidoglycan hydrolase)
MRTSLRSIRLFGASLLWAVVICTATQPATPADHTMISTQRTTLADQKPRFRGVASWYGSEDQGLTMANGQPFDCHKLTAASWSLALGTKIRVVNVKNYRSVVVTITDRGPNHRLHRALDLSEAAAERLGFVNSGLTRVFYSPVVTQPLKPTAVHLPSHIRGVRAAESGDKALTLRAPSFDKEKAAG